MPSPVTSMSSASSNTQALRSDQPVTRTCHVRSGVLGVTSVVPGLQVSGADSRQYRTNTFRAPPNVADEKVSLQAPLPSRN
ncbi:unannotated protein [freshwater metagenome]|uniref:Unannotated protein n=1 Tax=freshwater metagenome TaxID=449393 RepID=A0A6J6DMG7_9ZZZZ